MKRNSIEGVEPQVQLLTIEETTKRLGISRSHVYKLIIQGELPSVRIGRSRRIRLEALNTFVERHESGFED